MSWFLWVVKRTLEALFLSLLLWYRVSYFRAWLLLIGFTYVLEKKMQSLACKYVSVYDFVEVREKMTCFICCDKQTNKRLHCKDCSIHTDKIICETCMAQYLQEQQDILTRKTTHQIVCPFCRVPLQPHLVTRGYYDFTQTSAYVTYQWFKSQFKANTTTNPPPPPPLPRPVIQSLDGTP